MLAPGLHFCIKNAQTGIVKWTVKWTVKLTIWLLGVGFYRKHGSLSGFFLCGSAIQNGSDAWFGRPAPAAALHVPGVAAGSLTVAIPIALPQMMHVW